MLFKRCCACCGTRRRQSRSNKVKVTFKDESDAGQGRRRRRRRATYRYEVVYHHEENLRNDYLDPLPRLADSSAVPDPRGLPPAAGLNPLCPSYSHLSNYGNINDYSTQSLVWQLPQDHYKSPRHCLATQVPEQVSKDPVNYSVHLRPLPLSLGAEGTEFGASAELNRGFGNTDCTFHTIEHFKALEKSGKLQRLLQEKYLRVPELPEGSFGSPGSFPAASSPLGDSGSTLLLGSSPGSEIIRQRNRSSAEEMNSRANIDFQNPPGGSRNGVPASPGYREGSFGILGQLSEEELGPLPENWEKACTERGEAYFIDHNTGTSQWLDPRLSKVQKKSLDECTEDELPYGWEKIDDPHYGTYYIDHVNRKTQYENPVLEARKETLPTVTNPETDGRNGTIPRTKKTQQLSGNATRENKTVPRKSKYLLRSYFTRNPAELKGERIFTTLVKLNRGLGFTVIGGDDSDEEFLQIKSVVPNGPAWVDGRLQSGDILVYVNNQCVLGFTHQDMVNMFQAISPGEAVSLEVCRGYPLPFDPDDPNTEIVTTVAVSSSSSDQQQQQQAFLRPEENLAEAEFITVQILKGSMGFGFTIADSSSGQKVKTILDTARCKNLQEGDVLIDINGVGMQNLSHAEVVQHLKDCPLGQEASITIQRGGGGPVPSKNRWKKGKEGPPVPRKPQMGTVPGGLYRSKTPTADLYSMQPKEVVPSRSKTPLVDTRNRSKTPTFGLDYYDRDAMDNDLRFLERAYGRYPTNGSVQFQPKGSRDVDYANRGLVEFQSQDSGYETGFNGPVRSNQQSLLDGQMMGTNQGLARDFADPRLTAGLGGNLESDWLEMTVTLFRHESGFGFRIVGGTEEGSQVSIGHIVPGGAADMDGRLRSGDEIVSVDGQSVAHTSHHHVVQLMGAAALSGKVTLGIRRFTDPHRINPAAYDGQGRIDPVYPYDVTVNRTEKEGFGFVIISSVTKSMSFIGQILRGSPAERCSRLHVGDRILAVNQRDISQMHHGDIVNLIKDSGYSVTLTVGPPADDSSSTTSNSQRNEDVAMVTAQAMLAPTADTSSLLQTSNGFVPHTDATDAPFMEGSDGLGGEFYAVELKRGNRGFGFSIRGGSEFQMPIFVLRIAEDGPAAAVQTMRAGDYLIEINGLSTHNLTHADAIERIKQGGPVVRLLLQRQQQQMQQLQQQTYNSAPTNGDRMLSPITAPSADSPFIPDTLPPTTSMAHLHQAPNHSTPNGTVIPPPSAMTTPTALPPANHRASGRFQGPTKPRPLGNPASGDYYWRS